MPSLFVTGSGTEVGKTFVTCALLRAFVQRGLDVDVLKPVVSGLDPDHPQGSDPWLLIEACGREPSPAELARVAPFQYRAPQSPPLAARLQGLTLDAANVEAVCAMRIADADGSRLLLIEGAGGVMSPVDDDTTVLDLIEALEIPAVLVTGSYLGAISHTLTALEALHARGVVVAALVISESKGTAGPGLDETRRAVERLSGLTATVIRRGATELDAAAINALAG